MTFLLDMTTARFFVSVVEEGSIAGASRRESIAPSAISKRVAELEDRVGLRLLERHARGVELTAAGAAVLRRSRNLLHEARQLAAEVTQFGTGVQGHVRVAATETSLVGFIPDVLGAFLDANPGIRVDLNERLSTEVVRMVERQSADLGIYAGETSPGELWSQVCHRDQVVAVMRWDHPLSRYPGVTLAELLDHDIIGQDLQGGLGALVGRNADRLGRSMRTRVRADGYDVVCRLAQKGLGIGIIAESSAMLFAAQMGLASVGVMDSWARREHRICARLPTGGLSPAARLLLEHVLNPSGAPMPPSPSEMDAS